MSRARLLQAALLAALALLAVLLLRWQPAPAFPRPDGGRLLLAGALVVAYALACVRNLRRRPRAQPAAAVDDEVWVVHASQTGFAESLARRTADTLRTAGVAAVPRALGGLDVAGLARRRRVLFVVSTTGEGDAPDTAFGFVRHAMGAAPASTLDDLRYGLLALGDRHYARFCAFGHALDRWLRQAGARPLFDLVEVDDGDPGALRHWQQQLHLLGGGIEIADWREPDYQRWRLVSRRLLNAGSLGAPVFHLGFEAIDGARSWAPGDIAEIGPCNDPATIERFLAAARLDGAARAGAGSLREALARRLLPTAAEAIAALAASPVPALLDALPVLPHREYSIASLPGDGRLELVVRQLRHADGTLGRGSGWLSEYAPLGAPVALRVRANPNFHLPDGEAPLVLIGNGTGIAGLRAHLRARVAAGRRRNWLLFGERQAAHDFLFGEELEAARREGFVERLDLAFSRDQAERVHVQQRLREQRERLAAWIAQGAFVLVCGSVAGMAPGVDEVLREALGEIGYEGFVESGRYRRDVY